MNRIIGIIALIVIGGALIVGSMSVFTVQQTQQALVLQFGEPKRVITEPGLHFKLPFLQTVEYLERRLLDLDAPAEELIAADQKRLVVDAFARWKIIDPLRFYQSLRTEVVAQQRLASILNSSLRRVLGRESFFAVLSGERANLMVQIRELMNQEARGIGIEVVDVRIRRADLPEANSQAIFQRMQTERQREAAEFRAQGKEAAQRIRSRADREVTVLKAEAQREAEIIRGRGDAERNRIFADAFSRDPSFFAFYRSMIAYERALQAGDTTMVLSPDSEFFEFFGNPAGQPRTR